MITTFRFISVNTIRIFSLVIGMMIPAGLIAQDLTGDNWYFGSAVRDLRFSRSDHSPSLVTNQATPFAVGGGGTAVATDATTGNVLFYTDGERVYNWAHQPMFPAAPAPAPPILLGDNTQNQPVAICKNPAVGNQYYIFHRQAGTLRYTIVDVSLAGGAPPNTPARGEIGQVNQNIPGFPTGLSEAMVVIPSADKSTFFLISHISGTNQYAVLPITATGFGTLATIPVTGSAILQAASFSVKRISATVNLLAVASGESMKNVEVLSFDEGAMTLTARRIPLSGAATTGTYDTEFSSNGRYLYVSVNGALPAVAPNILQFDLNADPTAPPLTADTVNLPATVEKSFGLQMGPDSVIYHLYQNQGSANFLLGSFDNTNDVASTISYNPTAFTGNFGGKQFPSFASYRSPLSVSFVTDGECQNTAIAFYPTVVPGADSLVWELGDGTIVTEWSPVHTYTVASANVKVTAYLNGQSESAEVPLSFIPFDTQIQLVQDTTACTCELPFSKKDPWQPPRNTNPCNGKFFSVKATVNGSGSANWTWFGPAGEMNSGSGATAELFPDSAGYYYVIAQVGTCFAYAGVNIKEYAVPDQRANVWYFGNGAGLDFNYLPENPAKAISNPVMNAPEGTSTISDRNGQVIFFTDGDKVWGPESAGFPELADDIGGDPLSTQSVLIVPVPGDETLHYIFTTKEIYGTGEYIMSYSLFDRKVLPNGAVVQKNIELFRSSTERVTASQSGWLIAHEYGNNVFRAYRITGQGIGSPVFSAIGSEHSFTSSGNAEGYMKLGPQNRLAVAIPDLPPGSNSVEVFDFIDSTGVVTNFRSLTLSYPGKVYGIEFAGDKLYATVSNTVANGGSRLYEFLFNAAGIPSELTPTTPAGPPQSSRPIAQELGAIQIAPDGQIYVAVKNPTPGPGFLGVLQPVGSATAISPPMTFTRQLAPGTTSTLGLPNFIQSIGQPLQQPGMNIAGLCAGDSTFFTGSGTDVIDKFTWILDGVVVKEGFNETSYNTLFKTAGSHTIQLIITNRCVGQVFNETRNFQINAPPPAPDPQSVRLCTPPLELHANTSGTPNLTYLWQTGSTQENIFVSTPGDYRVQITSTVTQCVTDTMITVERVMPPVSLGPDVNQCSGAVSVTLNTNFASGIHEWTQILNGTVTPVGTNSNSLQVNFTTPGQVFYTVKITDPRPVTPPQVACFVTDTISFTINRAPDFVLNWQGPTICGATDARLFIALQPPALPNTVSYYLDGTLLASNVTILPTPPTPPPGFEITNTAAAGLHTVRVEDDFNGCPDTQTANIVDGLINIDPIPPLTICANQQQPVNVSTDLPAASPIRYTIMDANGNLVPGANNTAATTDNVGDFQTVPLGPGTYSISILATASGCTNGTTIIINPGAQIAGATLTTDVCGANPTAVASPSDGNLYSYTWEGTALSGPVATNDFDASLARDGNVKVTIHDLSLAACDVILEQPIVLTNLTPAFTYDQCAAIPITLTSGMSGAGSGIYIYEWFVADNLGSPKSSFATTPNASADASFDTKSVTVVITDLGATCPDNSFESIPMDVNVVGPVDVDFTPDPLLPCEGAQFQLIATSSKAIERYTWSKDNQPLPPPPAPGDVLTTIGRGTYTVVALFRTCEGVMTKPVITRPTDPGDLDDEYTICPSPSNPDPATRKITLDAGTGITDDPDTRYTAFQWYEIDENGNTTDIATATGQTLEVDVVGAYGVRLTSQYCVITDETFVFQECEPVITAPNAFRPGSTVTVAGALTNEQFRLFTFFIEDSDFQIYIFNRWGEMVFQSMDRKFAWNGGYGNNSSNLLPAGTYTYVVRYRSTDRPEYGVREKRGGVVLMR